MHALVTGANRGIGLELCRQLQQRGANVIGVCRVASEALTALGVEVLSGIELTDAEKVEQLASALAGRKLDLLVQNAGILSRDSFGELPFDALKAQFEVNALAPLRVTQALLRHLASPGKVALITSRMGSIEDNTSGGYYGYRMSKAALNMAGASLAHDLRPRGIAVALLHPGFVRTEMTNGNGQIDPDVSARGLLARIDELTLETSGAFWHQNGERLPW